MKRLKLKEGRLAVAFKDNRLNGYSAPSVAIIQENSPLDKLIAIDDHVVWLEIEGVCECVPKNQLWLAKVLVDHATKLRHITVHTKDRKKATRVVAERQSAAKQRPLGKEASL